MSDLPATTGVTASTPEPVLKAAALWGTLSTFVLAAVGMLVTFNVLSPEYADLTYSTVDYVSANLVGTGTTVAGLVGIVTGLVSPWVTAFAARRKVTPVPEPVATPPATDYSRTAV